jgi:large subunit ribosomal protein L13
MSRVTRVWHQFDATNYTVGRLASRIATVLSGKHKPTYSPHDDSGDYVIVTNAEKVKFTGNKLAQKTYYRHTGWPGGIKSITAGKLMEKKPENVLRSAVSGMLPRNKLRPYRMERLKIYVDSAHPHTQGVYALHTVDDVKRMD